MKRLLSLFILGASLIFLNACDEDPAKQVKVISRPAGKNEAASLVLPKISHWNPPGCSLKIEDRSGPSALDVNGPCGLLIKAQAKCHAKLDDFFVILERETSSGGKLTLFLNVEHYHGPGDYLLGRMFVSLEEGTALYRWSSDNVSVKVGADEAFVELPTTRMEAEPLLNRCQPVVAADGSYHFPCEAKRIESPVDGTTEILTGKIVCDSTLE